MDIERKATQWLEQWKLSPGRKPLIMRGARQVGKTFLVKRFAKSYPQCILLNLEKDEDRLLFEQHTLDNLITYLFAKNQLSKEIETLIFIDEIQASPKAIHCLRFFYEDYPHLHVIAAGSLLEFALGEVKSFPVGRVEQFLLHPVSFEEYLQTVNPTLMEFYHQVPISKVGVDLILPHFHQYTIIGGMPEVVKTFLSNKDYAGIAKIYQNLWQSYIDDTEKYAKNATERKVLRHILEYGHFEQDRIKYNNFANSDYKSREVSEAFQALDRSRIIRVIKPITQTTFPAIPNLNRSPRLQFLDTGLLNYLLGIQADMIGINDLNSTAKGKIAQHIVTQELIANHAELHFKPLFWTRENRVANAELDLILEANQRLIPIEIKSGSKGSLRSLMQFIDESPVNFGIRLSPNYFSKETTETISKKTFTLYNVPYFHVNKVAEYLSID
jgi:uncharacterized protein